MKTYEISVKNGFFIGDVTLNIDEEHYALWEKNQYKDGVYKDFIVVDTPIIDQVATNTGFYFPIVEANIGVVDLSICPENLDLSTGFYDQDYSGVVILTKEDNGNVKVEWLDNIVRLYIEEVPEDLEIEDSFPFSPVVDAVALDDDTIMVAIDSDIIEKYAEQLKDSGALQILQETAENTAESNNTENSIILDNGNIITARLVTEEDNTEE